MMGKQICEIEDFKAIVQSAKNEYFSENISEYRALVRHVLGRTSEIARGIISEDEYVGEWIDQLPSFDEAHFKKVNKRIKRNKAKNDEVEQYEEILDAVVD